MEAVKPSDDPGANTADEAFAGEGTTPSERIVANKLAMIGFAFMKFPWFGAS
jgi:hypothetical protein